MGISFFALPAVSTVVLYKAQDRLLLCQKHYQLSLPPIVTSARSCLLTEKNTVTINEEDVSDSGHGKEATVEAGFRINVFNIRILLGRILSPAESMYE